MSRLAATLALLIPFFGLIAIGFVAARLSRLNADALGWMNIFIVYAALPALFFKLVSRTPMADLTRVDFIFTQLTTVYTVFLLMLLIATVWRRATLAEGVIQAFGAAYGNIGYMGPGLALLVLGDAAAVPVALFVCFENAVHFVVAPALMAIATGDARPPLADDFPVGLRARDDLDAAHRHADAADVEVGQRLPQVPYEPRDEPRPVPALEGDLLVMNDD